MKALIAERLAIHVLLAVFLVTTVFHVLVVVGVVPFAIVWSGRLRDHSQMLRFEAGSLTVTLLMLAIVAVRAGYMNIKIPARVMTVVFSLMFLLFLANTAGNLASKNALEKRLFTPLTLVLALLSLRVAMGRATARVSRRAGTKPFAELDTVQLQQAHAECGLDVGAVGTVVLVHRQGEAYEVEFVRPDGSTQAILTLPADEVAAPSARAVQETV